MVTSDFRPEVKIRPFRACVMHPAIIIGTFRSFWTWLWGRYHVRQNVRISSLSLDLTIFWMLIQDVKYITLSTLPVPEIDLSMTLKVIAKLQ